MPKTKKEGLYFGLMMCFGMAVVMGMYNMIRSGQYEQLTFGQLVLGLLLAFVVAFVVELVIVGPVARKLAFKLPFTKKKKVIMILTISTLMVIGMVVCMSAFGLIMSHSALSGASWSEYGENVWKNFVVAYPLQLLIMGPVVRFLFVKFVQKPARVSLPS